MTEAPDDIVGHKTFDTGEIYAAATAESSDDPTTETNNAEGE